MMPTLAALLLGLYGACLGVILAFSLGQWHLTRLARRAWRQPPPPPLPPPAAWPTVLVQLPVYNERYVVERVIDAAAALDYPPECLHIQVLDDSTDDTVDRAAGRVAEHRRAGLRIEHLRRAERTGFKAGALAAGLARSEAELVAIFDADFVPAPDWLRRTVPAFGPDPGLGVLQTRWGHLNEDANLLTRLQAFGLNAHFFVEQVGRSSGGLWLNFNGTGGVWRRACIEAGGGWTADTLTEDLDLSYRAQLRGWRFAYTPHVVAPAELPTGMAALKSQQFRWSKGAAETARKHLRGLWAAPGPGRRRWHGAFHLLNSSVYVVILLMGLLSVPLVWVRAGHAEFRPAMQAASVFLLGFFPLIFYFHSAWRLSRAGRPGWRFAGALLLFLSVSMGLSLHNSRAVLLGWAGRASAFVRTPKQGAAPAAAGYRAARGGRGRWLAEALLAAYFAWGLGAGLYLGDWGLLPFHAMLTLGFGLVAWESRK